MGATYEGAGGGPDANAETMGPLLMLAPKPALITRLIIYLFFFIRWR